MIRSGCSVQNDVSGLSFFFFHSFNFRLYFNPANHKAYPFMFTCQVSYAIGVPRPLSLYVDSYGTSGMTNKELEQIVLSNFDLRPGIIIRYRGFLNRVTSLHVCSWLVAHTPGT